MRASTSGLKTVNRELRAPPPERERASCRGEGRRARRALVILERVGNDSGESRRPALLGSVSTCLASFVPSNGRAHNSSDTARARARYRLLHVSRHVSAARTREAGFTERTISQPSAAASSDSDETRRLDRRLASRRSSFDSSVIIRCALLKSPSFAG